MTEAPTIRFVKKIDLGQLVSLCKAHAHYEKADFDEEGKESALEKSLFSTSPALYCLVVEEDGKLIGYTTFMKQFSTWNAGYYLYMDCLFLSERTRGKGIGQSLMERLQNEAEKMGCLLIQWQTPDFNIRAIHFYNRLGATSKDKKRFFLKAQH